MKFFFLLAGAALCCSCLSDPYFNGLNTAPVINSGANLSVIDTLKIGRSLNAGREVYYQFPVKVSDINNNLQRLVVAADSSIQFTDNSGKKIPLRYETVDIPESSVFLLYPTRPGLYKVSATITDKFQLSSGISKTLFVFDNLSPLCKASSAYYEVQQIVYTIHVDLGASFDRDARFGGRVSGYHAIYHSSSGETWNMRPAGATAFEAADLAGSIGWVEAWVIDNEEAESEHIRINPVRK